NLLSNAFKYTMQGRITVSLHPAGDSIALNVADTGAGIPADELPHVFERFHRVAGIQGRTHEGTGSGLALVQELARLPGGAAAGGLEGGWVGVASTRGTGSPFRVTVPLGTPHVPANRLDDGPALAATSLGAAPYLDEALRWLPRASAEPSAAADAIVATPSR